MPASKKKCFHEVPPQSTKNGSREATPLAELEWENVE